MAKSGLLPENYEDKKKYCETLELIDGDDPYAIPRKKWTDNMDFWPAITYVHTHRIVTSTYSLQVHTHLQNYKSPDRYGRFLAG